MLGNVQPTEYGMNITHNVITFVQGHAKEFGYMRDCGWKWLKVHFKLFQAILK